MKLRIFKLTDIVRYADSIIDNGLEVTPTTLRLEAYREGFRMTLREARRYVWTLNYSALIKSPITLAS